MRRFTLLLAATLLLLLPLACSENTAGPAPMRGSLTITVALTDEYGRRMSNHGDVTVSLEGTDYTVTTDAEGFCTFNDIPAGTYVIDFRKPGFSPFKIYGYGFVGGGNAYIREVYMTELPPYTINEISATVSNSGSPAEEYVAVRGTISDMPEELNRVVRVYFSTSSSVSSAPGEFTAATTATVHSPGTEFYRTFPLEDLRRFGIASGARVYVVAYPMSQWTVGYFDQTKRKWYETNVAPQHSTVASFEMP